MFEKFFGARRTIGKFVVIMAVAIGVATLTSYAREIGKWDQHSEERPAPKKVDPGDSWSDAPSDAIVLFDGEDLSEWQHGDGSKAKWKVKGDYMEVVPGTGSIKTKKTFGDAQLHVEWATDPEAEGHGQHLSNSGVFFGSYEVQVLDTYKNKTYADGMAGALYGQYPPLVNATRPTGEWQSFDIVYRRPRFKDGEVVQPATFTVFHNGVLVQECEELVGPTSHGKRTPYRKHGDLPVSLQDHGHKLRFRNIWIRELDESKR